MAPSHIREHVDHALGDRFSYELDLLEPLVGGTESEIDSPLYRVCERFVSDRIPGATLLPVVSAGFSDSHFVREAFGTVAYGFAPVFSTDPSDYFAGMHGADECLDVDDLVEMAEFHLHVLRSDLLARGAASSGDA